MPEGASEHAGVLRRLRLETDQDWARCKAARCVMLSLLATAPSLAPLASGKDSTLRQYSQGTATHALVVCLPCSVAGAALPLRWTQATTASSPPARAEESTISLAGGLIVSGSRRRCWSYTVWPAGGATWPQ